MGENTLSDIELADFRVILSGELPDPIVPTDGVLNVTGQVAPSVGLQLGPAIDVIHKTRKVTLNAVQIKAAAATPFELVTAVANKMMIFKHAAYKFTAGAEILVEPTAPDDFAIRYVDGSGDIVSDTIDSTILFASAGPVDAYAEMHPILVAPGVLAARVNVALVLHNTGGDLTGNASNDASLDVWVDYIEVDMV